MSDPTKKGDFDDMIDLVSKPSQDPSSSVSTFIYVHYTEAVMYALPIDQCRSWFVSVAMTSYFGTSLTRYLRPFALISTTSGPPLSSLPTKTV